VRPGTGHARSSRPDSRYSRSSPANGAATVTSPAAGRMKLLNRLLEKAGFKVARVAGSHHIMRHPDGRGTTVPVHPGRDVAKGTLRGILADAGLTIQELQRFL
jgi:predicted RNA binding protein YcfA (HicA-like mRNA interferase family)